MLFYGTIEIIVIILIIIELCDCILVTYNTYASNSVLLLTSARLTNYYIITIMITITVRYAGVMEAVDAIIEHLKRMSKQVTTPQEITQVCYTVFIASSCI